MAAVLMVVIDGLQPASVRADPAPNVARFAGEGVFLERHHPAFPSVTRVNGASRELWAHPPSSAAKTA